LAGCISTPADPTTSLPGLGDCLNQVEMKKLRRALARCNQVVDAHPQQPQPRNERALLHSLVGDNKAACSDSRAAAELLKQVPKTPAPDPLLVEEIQLRAKSCQVLTTGPATAAPKPAGRGV
jgi:regulator of sirC expression with transglutaminase-like and TPR domain